MTRYISVCCDVCRMAQSRGFGWQQPSMARNNPKRFQTRKHFCSKHCQNIFYHYYQREHKMIDPSDLEKECLNETLQPLAEYLTNAGIMSKPVYEITGDEMATILRVIIGNYQENLQTKCAAKAQIEPDIPF